MLWDLWGFFLLKYLERDYFIALYQPTIPPKTTYHIILTWALINPVATECGSVSGWNMTYFLPSSPTFNQDIL